MSLVMQVPGIVQQQKQPSNSSVELAALEVGVNLAVSKL